MDKPEGSEQPDLTLKVPLFQADYAGTMKGSFQLF